MVDRYETEAAIFDAEASSRIVQPMRAYDIERYKNPKHPNLFPKEMMFHLLDKKSKLNVLEIGCGEGVASVQLACCGHDVVGIDISPKSIDVAKKRAQLQGQVVRFMVGNLVSDDLCGESQYDVVWCDAILHHLVGDLDIVVGRLWKALRKGGLFVACEPVAYADWLRKLRYAIAPSRKNGSQYEQPLRSSEMEIIDRYFPGSAKRYYRIFARIDRITPNLDLIAMAARLDNVLLSVPACKSLAGTVVIWARKKDGA